MRSFASLRIKKMKNFNKTLHEDIALLRTLHVNKDKREFNDMKAEIMQKHNISKATVYREMKKETPGEYKTPNYNPPKMDINTQEVLMVRELLLAGRQNTEIIKIMGRELGINYYWDRFDRARALGEELNEEEYDPKKTSFAENGRMFLTKLFNIEYMAPRTFNEITVNGHILKVTKGFYENMVLQLMKYNHTGNKDTAMKYLLSEVDSHFMLKNTIMRTIEELAQSRESPSAYALKSLYETREKIEKRDFAMYELKKYLIENNPWGLNKKPESETPKEEEKEAETEDPTEISPTLSYGALKPMPAAGVVRSGRKVKIPDQTISVETLPDGKKLDSRTIRKRTKNGKLTRVTVIKKYS